MTGASKILTVSYGTFSCTLEGFDDPFSTMQSIAEYFRDLAADDRYFGAEPPTPDMAMLQRIAAQSQPGRIQARLNDDGVVLRQTDAAPAAAPAVAPAPVAPAPAPVAAPAAVAAAPDSVADKLSRIRAVVARSGGDLGGFVEEESRFPPDAAANAASAPAPLRLETPVAPEPVAPIATDSVNNGYQDEDEEVPSVLDEPADVIPAIAEADEPAHTSEHDDHAEVAALPDAADGEDLVSDSVTATTEGTDVSSEATPEKVETPVVADTPAAPQVEDDLSARLAELRKADALKDADEAQKWADTQDDTSEVGPVEDDLDEMAQASDDTATDDSLESSIEDRGDAVEATDLDDEEFETFAKAPVARGDVAVDRILEKTNSEMNEHEGSRRRSAIAHLKAAVAATRADGGRGSGTQNDDNAMTQFRDDLAKAVRPQRPSANQSGHRDVRPEMNAAAAPLMLVPSLRVDGDDGEKSLSVRPRRVANSDAGGEEKAASAEVPTTSSFAEFVAEQEARELPELMEAAAAYATHVEGRSHVTRPLVMSRVLEQRDGLKREDALRTFGRLLRDGRIVRLKRGKFAVAEDTRFRAAGNQ